MISSRVSIFGLDRSLANCAQMSRLLRGVTYGKIARIL